MNRIHFSTIQIFRPQDVDRVAFYPQLVHGKVITLKQLYELPVGMDSLNSLFDIWYGKVLSFNILDIVN